MYFHKLSAKITYWLKTKPLFINQNKQN